VVSGEILSITVGTSGTWGFASNGTSGGMTEVYDNNNVTRVAPMAEVPKPQPTVASSSRCAW